jgi:DNA-binding MarR family transcriptional regulator
MPSASDQAARPTHMLVEAGKILRALKPSTLGTLLVIYADDTQTQKNISDAIGCARSTVSKYLQILEDLTLAKKKAQRYTVTAAGEEVIGLMSSMVGEWGIDLFNVNWSSDDDKETVASILTPLYDSRSASSFFILDSLYARGGTIGRLSQPQTVQIEDVVQDVDVRQTERGESTTTESVRQKLRRFNDAGVIEFDGRRITLTETKGIEHGQTLFKLVDFLIDQEDTDQGGTESTESMSSPASAEAPADPKKRLSQIDSSVETHLLDESATQIDSHRSLGSRPSVISQSGLDLPTIIPAYYLRQDDDRNTEVESQVQPQQSPVLPLTALTVGELSDHISRIIDENAEDAQLVPYWTIQTESEYIPVYPAIPQQNIRVSEQNDV